MPRFFCDAVTDEEIQIVGEDASHIRRVLRMKVGEALTVCADGVDYACEIAGFDGDAVRLTVLEKHPNDSEPSVRVTLYQALPKGDKMEFIVQKAVELGAVRIVPMLTKRCVSRPDAKSMQKKLVRYQKVAKEAAKQCGRGMVPEVGEMVTLERALAQADAAVKVLFYEGGGQPIQDLLNEQSGDVAVFIGSEGGFETEEVDLAKRSGAQIATLGKRILRCETAPLAALSIIMNRTGNI